MTEKIIVEKFPELQREYATKGGVLNEYANLQAAHGHFAKVMRAYEYRPGINGIWLKPGFAAVMEPQ